MSDYQLARHLRSSAEKFNAGSEYEVMLRHAADEVERLRAGIEQVYTTGAPYADEPVVGQMCLELRLLIEEPQSQTGG